MKKLLALVLCVMLFVSVVPASAFAANETIDLYPAVQQMQNLDNAYARFATANILVNAYNGFMELSKILGPNASAEAIEEAEKMGENYQLILDHVKSLKTGMSYEGLYMLLFPQLMYHLSEATEDVGDDLIAVIETMEADVTAAIENLGNPFA